ncbi:uncharacterized protein B0H18DRAFT_1083228 [Fomitopsis serialis]|uniref:uncharacterized protein n=1 Tax=Fomitopsis serialis TaxID=139415 RepID=UPI0020082971|nr:uncharacterized protein B0H18DRAFT_1083228 [Neoantrodia serialis]KAH9933068.1 hypothetical protein B0H18DRAFT_1083228 [Neoantrodia serialis]
MVWSVDISLAIPPAWRTAPGATANGKRAGPAAAKGSKIMLSQLPMDVAENEVEILFAKTVGPVKDTFIVRRIWKPESAALAREKYNGKIVDGRRPIKIEIIKDDNEIPSAAPEKKSLSLLERIGQTSKSVHAAPGAQRTAAKAPAQPKATKATQKAAPKTAAAQRPIFAGNAKAKLRTKKGPKRIQKQQQRKVVTAEQLDQEMEDYRASTDTV